jgi:hypothetical protein
MELTWKQFYSSYAVAPDEVKATIDSTQIPTCVKKAVATHQLDSTHYRELVKLYSLYVLDVINQQAMVEEMRQLGIPDGKAILTELEQCRQVTPITPVSFDDDISDIEQDIAAAETALANNEIRSATPLPPPPTNQPVQPVPIAEPVHTSSQADVLRPTSPLPPPPKKTPSSDIPRWNSNQ